MAQEDRNATRSPIFAREVNITLTATRFSTSIQHPLVTNLAISLTSCPGFFPEQSSASQASNISRRAVISAIDPSVNSQPMNVSNNAREVLIPTAQSSVHSLLKAIVLNSSK